MNATPRLALASPVDRPQPSAIALAWLAGFSARGRRVQFFQSRACPVGTEQVCHITGLPARHLDGWLMSEALLRSLFVRGTNQAEFALVEGILEEPSAWLSCGGCSGSLRPLVEAIDLPVIYVLPCPSPGSPHLGHIPDDVDGVFLDGVEDATAFHRLRHFIQLSTGKPVVGGIERLPEIREAVDRFPRGRDLPPELIERLGRSFLRFADMAAIESLATSRPVPVDPAPREPRKGGRFRVAYAMDEAFGAYFPDTLEALESLGAELLDFSPLRDERLPDLVDLVMIGCGFPDRYAGQLSQNFSLIAELQSYVLKGHRLYAEGGGAAYLGRCFKIGETVLEAAGILPFVADLVDDPEPPMPVERQLQATTWLGARGTTVRGYLSGRWRLQPLFEQRAGRHPLGSLVSEGEIYYHGQAVGGLMHLHLASLAEFLTPRHSLGALSSKPS